MPARERIAGAIVRRFEERRPGASLGLRLPEPNGGEHAWLSSGDAWDVYFRDMRRRAVVQHSMSPRNALRLAWFILWRWWVCELWCGVKLRAWLWALRVRSENSATKEPA
jgi:hypothetical protein